MNWFILHKFNLWPRIATPNYHPDDIGDVSDIGVMNDDGDNTDGDENDDGDKTEKDDKEKEETDTDDEETEDDGDKDKGDVDDDEEKEEDDEDKDEETDEETDEEKDQPRLTTYTDIKKVYPEFFKKFPDIRAALFRDQRYGEMFANPDEAQVAGEKAASLDRIENDLINKGKFEDLLALVQKGNKESYESIVYNFLPHLQESNKELYLEVAAVPIKQLLRAAWREGKGKETDLGRAAAYIHKYFFNDLDIDKAADAENKHGKAKGDGKTAKEKELEDKLNEINTREERNFNTSVDKSYLSRMEKDIITGLEKDERITPYMMSKLVTDILYDIKAQLNKDTRYLTTMRSLFSQAKAAGLTDDFKSRIVSTALARAKALIPATRSRLVSDALKSKKAVSGKVTKPQTETKTERRESRDTRPNTNSNGRKAPLTDMDILRSR